jgi:hypothetical protein
MYSFDLNPTVPHQVMAFASLKKVVAYLCHDYHIPFSSLPLGEELAEDHIGFPLNYLFRLRELRSERPFILSKIKWVDDSFVLVDIGQYKHLGDLFCVLSSQYRGRLILSHPLKGYFDIVSDRPAPLIPYVKSLEVQWGRSIRQGVYVHELGQGVVSGVIRGGKHHKILQDASIPIPTLSKTENQLKFEEVSSA